ncbi:hypothetical protein GMO_16230 [Gluconobacter morbifer G707]|uniref:Uncharacterized protein n=1 Tax=Gluconobacter morbifer G707 TaxID=1088869 RepID=G6XJP4_9PROT|nr:hypothetical protein GMO_16230 [Gluconobacter morbifer G707]
MFRKGWHFICAVSMDTEICILPLAALGASPWVTTFALPVSRI